MFEGREIQTLTASVAIFGVFVLLRWMKRNGSKGKRYPPSLPLLPLLGSILRGGMAVLPEHFRRSAEKLGPVFSFTVGRSMVVVINGYETLANALGKQSETFADRVPLWIETVINPELRGIVFARYGDVLKKHKKLSLSILKEFGYGQVRVTETRILQEVENIREEILKHNGCPFDPKWPIIFASSDVIIGIVFGNNFRKSLPEDHSAIVKNSIECISNMDMTLNIAPFARFLPAYRKTVDGLRTSNEKVLKAVESGIQFIKSTNAEATFVGRFLEIEGADYDHQDLVFVVRDLCFAGTETVATTLLWAVVELANHCEVQDRLQREIDEMVPGDRHPSLDDKPRLLYSEAVILEVMRLRTIVPLYVPHSTTKDTKLLDYDIPKGTMVIGNGYSAHMDQKFWTDPENFRPERFLDADNGIVNNQRVIPFGLGKRTCLGEILARQSIFLFLTSLVQRFDIRPPDGQNSIKVQEVTAITTCPSDFQVRLIPRVKLAHGD